MINLEFQTIMILLLVAFILGLIVGIALSRPTLSH